MRRFSTAHGNPSEMAHFAQLAKSWWDPTGPQRILHKMNLMRLDFMRETLEINGAGAKGYSPKLIPPQLLQESNLDSIKPKLNVLDIGCGGGLLSESMARLPFVKSVTGVDVTPEVIEVAKQHSLLDPALKGKLNYELKPVEDLTRKQEFDMVTMYEVLEHLDEPSFGLRKAMSLVKPGGWLFLSTINRTLASYMSTIFLGEYVLGIVPKGTHTWTKYINSNEVREFVEKEGQWQVARTQGTIYLPTQGWVRFDPTSTGPLSLLNCAIGQTGGNYVMAMYRQPEPNPKETHH